MLRLWSLKYLREKDKGLAGMPASLNDFHKYEISTALAPRRKSQPPVQIVNVKAEWFEVDGRLRKITTDIELEKLRDYYRDSVQALKDIDLKAVAKKTQNALEFTAARANTPPPPPRPAEPPKNIHGEPIGYFIEDGRLAAYLNWELERENMLSAIAASSEGAYLTGSMMRIVDGRIVCTCQEMLTKKVGLCRHIKHAYLTGKDGRLTGLKNVGSIYDRSLQVPIGIGVYYLTIKVKRLVTDDTEKDVPFLSVSCEMETKLRAAMQYTDRTEFLIADGEGMFGYIQHIEDMLHDHPEFRKLINMQDEELRSPAVMNGLGCSRRVHTPGMRQNITARLVRKNPNRTNNILATVACVLDKGVCLPHNDLGAGFDVPDMD